MSQFEALKVLGNVLPGLSGEIFGMLVFGALLVFWALVPLYDRDSKAGQRARIATWAGFLTRAGTVVFTILGYATL